ncbi:MAG: hypothetical protein JO252_13025 [Planctomycetaceae bacterium]|nr:hypothetical protein [Planctomycetaceae bacterium]
MLAPQIVETRKGQNARRYGLAAAGRLFFDHPPHPASMTRWILVGILLRSGERLKLRAERHPHRWVVSESAVRDFISRLTADRLGEPVPAAPEDSIARQRQLARTGAELDAIRI